jgi:GntR family glv operon transcriptional regulator
MTIRKALDLLVSWGLVERRHGSGTFCRAKTFTMKPPI